MHILPLILINEFVQVDGFVSDVLWALLIGFETESMTTLVHVDRA